MSINRRQFIVGSAASLTVFLVSGCSQILSPEEDVELISANKSRQLDTVADFLTARLPTEYRECDILPGSLLLVDFGSWGQGDYHYYIDGQLVAQAINITSYDAQRQVLVIKKRQVSGDWIRVWSYPRNRRTHYTPHESIPS